MQHEPPRNTYTVQQLGTLAGVSARTLRYYDEIGLLRPAAVAENGYRLYGPEQVAALQQILLYRGFGVPLKEILPLLQADRAGQATALQAQLDRLQARRAALADLADTLLHTISELKGERTMQDNERFTALKETAIAENEAAYGEEIRAKYGEESVNAANDRVKGMSEADWNDMQALNAEIAALLPRCAAAPDDAALAAKLCDTHRRWIEHTWGAGKCTPAAHLGLAQMYRADARFAAYYDAMTPGGCEALCRAIEENRNA